MGGVNYTLSQESTVVPAGLRYSMKVAATASTTPYISQVIETANAIAFAGQTITLSAYLSGSVATGITYNVGWSTAVDNPNSGSWTYLAGVTGTTCLLYTSPSPRDRQKSRMPSSA